MASNAKAKSLDVDELRIPDEILYLGEEAVSRFIIWCEQNGGPPQGFQYDLAVMYARNRACGANNTDRAFMEDRANGAQFAHWEKGGDIYAKIFKKIMGRDPPKGSVYSRQLARFAGDPKAWVDSISDVKRVARENNKTVEELGVRSIEKEIKRPAISERGIRRHLMDHMKKYPGRRFTEKEVAKLREKIVSRHGYHKGK